MPRERAPLPLSPPPPLDVSTVDSNEVELNGNNKKNLFNTSRHDALFGNNEVAHNALPAFQLCLALLAATVNFVFETLITACPFVAVTATGSEPSSDPRPATSFLKITELRDSIKLGSHLQNSGKSPPSVEV